MSVAERHLNSTYSSDELEFVLEQVRAGNYADALQALARAKANDPRNIFLIALERQVTRLRAGGVLPREKTEIVESLTGLVERARSDSHARTESPEQAPSQGTPVPPAGEKKDPRMKIVVEQYFRHADDWVKRRDFEAALKEIERVLLIDPENRVAKEYQSRVQGLFRIEQRDPLVAGSAPAAEVFVVADDAGGEGASGGKTVKKPVLLLVAGILVAVLVIVGIMFMRPSKGQYRVGYMYVTQAQLPAEEGQVVPSAPLSESSVGEESSAGGTPEVKPPEVAKPKAAEKVSSKPESEVASKPAVEEEAVEPPKAAPSTNTSAPSAPSAIAEKERGSEELAAPTKFIPVEEPPKIVQLQQPRFSEEQILAGIQGDVVVKVQIDKSGKPLQAKVISSTNAGLNEAVIDAVMRSSYAPGVMSSGPVTTWMTIPLKLK